MKKEYSDNTEDNTDSKNFWNRCLLNNNGDSKISLTDDEQIINESFKNATVFNSYFESVTESLDLFNWAPEPYDQAKDSA